MQPLHRGNAGIRGFDVFDVLPHSVLRIPDPRSRAKPP
jgi:hypothetical protein